jgi:hypothetical protein
MMPADLRDAGESAATPGAGNLFLYENRIRDFHFLFLCLDENHVVFLKTPAGGDGQPVPRPLSFPVAILGHRMRDKALFSR